tara:strand:+ start:4713 stop:5957 length:1245 start_codon:yes stop_codon:yes gene_type:complete
MAIYNPSTDPAFENVNLNALASQYAAQFGHNTSILIQKITRDLIYDAAPQQFFDLKLLNMKQASNVDSDEFFYQEMGFGRDPVQVTGAAAAAVYPVVQGPFTIANIDTVSEDTVLVYPDNSKGTITNVDPVGGTITVTPMTNGALPALLGAEVLANLSPVEADAADNISQYFRVETIERYNYVQMLIKAMRFGQMEMYKYKNAATTSNYLTMQKQRMLQQFRIDLSNILWNGERGEVTLGNAQVAKTTGGIFPLMQSAGSVNVVSTVATLDAALEDLALNTEFKSYGSTRFLYGTPRMIHQLSQVYKRDATMYRPNDEIAKLGLKGVDIGSTMIVFVPMKRFEESSCFPADWANRLILLDQESVGCVQTWGESMGETLAREDNGTLRNFTDYWISATFGVEFNNPLGSGWIDVI